MTNEEYERIISISYKVQNALNTLRVICDMNECGDGCPIYRINGNDEHAPYISCPCSKIGSKGVIENNGEKYRYNQIAIKNRH